MTTNPTTPQQALNAAHAALHDALNRWPTARHNLTDIAGPWPTGHEPPACTTDLDGYPETSTIVERAVIRPDAASRVLVSLEQRTKRATLRGYALLGIQWTIPATLTTQLYSLAALLSLARELEPKRHATTDADAIYHEVLSIRDVIIEWAWTRPTIGHQAGDTKAEAGCAHHQRTGHGFEPRFRGDLCRWCYEWRSANRALPPQAALDARGRGERITSRHLGRTA